MQTFYLKFKKIESKFSRQCNCKFYIVQKKYNCTMISIPGTKKTDIAFYGVLASTHA